MAAALPKSLCDREQDKFTECPTSGETAVRTTICNDATDPVIIDGEINFKAPTGPFTILVATATTTAADPITTPLTDRVSLSIRNKSSTISVYLGTDNTVTADDASTGGWEIGPSEDFNIDLADSDNFFLITPSGSATVKILEIAST